MILNDMSAVEAALQVFVKPPSKHYSLDAIKALLAGLGNPQDTLKVVHVAGTSGKTSTAYYAAALIQSAGYSVGLGVSPHIDTVRERTQVNGELIDEAEYRALLGEFLDIVNQSGIDVSYFELLVAFSFWTWARLGIEYAVVEVGLGGLLDGTNVVTRADKTAIITDIGYDHQEVLGETLPEIAYQKAGIILPGNSVFIHAQTDEVMKVVRKVAEEKQVVVNVVPGTTIPGTESLPLFQQRNFSLAYAAVLAATGERKIAVDQAVALVIPGRMERQVVQGKQVFLDGSHNGQKIGALVESFNARYPDLRPVIVVSFGAKRADFMREGLELLHEISDQIIATDFSGAQDVRHESLTPSEIAVEARRRGFSDIQEVPGVAHALATALGTDTDAVLVVGSFYALLEARAYLARAN